MEKFKFIGPEPVDVPALRLVDVQPGSVVDVSAEQAAGMFGSAVWDPASPATKKAADAWAKAQESGSDSDSDATATDDSQEN